MIKVLFAERNAIAVSTLLDTLEGQVEAHTKLAVEKLQNLDERTLLAPAGNGGWSVAQCIEHLNTYGYHYLPAISQALAGHKPENEPTHFTSSRLGQYFTKLMQPESGKTMKATPKHVPPVHLNPHAVIGEFIRQQETMLVLMRKVKKANLNQVKVRTSISAVIQLPLGDVFQFIVAHDSRHIAQAMRVLDSLSVR